MDCDVDRFLERAMRERSDEEKENALRRLRSFRAEKEKQIIELERAVGWIESNERERVPAANCVLFADKKRVSRRFGTFARDMFAIEDRTKRLNGLSNSASNARLFLEDDVEITTLNELYELSLDPMNLLRLRLKKQRFYHDRGWRYNREVEEPDIYDWSNYCNDFFSEKEERDSESVLLDMWRLVFQVCAVCSHFPMLYDSVRDHVEYSHNVQWDEYLDCLQTAIALMCDDDEATVLQNYGLSMFSPGLIAAFINISKIRTGSGCDLVFFDLFDLVDRERRKYYGNGNRKANVSHAMRLRINRRLSDIM